MPDRMCLTLVSQVFYPEMVGTGQILTELLVELARNAVDVSVICGQPSYYSIEKLPSIIRYDNICIRRAPGTQLNKNTLGGRVLNTISFFFPALHMLHREKRHGPVLLVTNPPFLGVVGPIIRLLKNRPFIMIIHDFYPDIAVSMGTLRDKSLAAIIWRRVNRWIFRHASYIVVIGRDMQTRVQDEVDAGDREKVVFIPNWADPGLIFPLGVEQNPFACGLGLGDKFIVQYSGNMGLSHDMDTIVEAAQSLRAESEIHFLMIGGGARLKAIQEKAQTYRLNNMRFLPYQDRDNIRYSLCASHVSLVSLERGAEGLVVPSKLYGILASGRPVIAIVPETSEIALTINAFQCGIVVPPHDVKGLASAICRLRADERERTDMGRRAYNAFLENFTVKKCSAQYEDILRRLFFLSGRNGCERL